MSGRATQSVVVADAPSGTILFNNAAVTEVGRSLRELAKSDAYAIYHSDGTRYEAAEWPLTRSIATGEVVVGETFFRRDGDESRRWFRVSSYPVYDGEGRLMAAVSVADDVSSERVTETERAYHASLLANVEDAVVGTDPDFRLTVWNHGAEHLYGFSSEEVLGRPARDVLHYAGEVSRTELERELRETDRARAELTANRKDGTTVEVGLLSVAIRDAEGALTGYLGIHRDMSEQRQANEDRVHRAHQQGLVATLGLLALGGDDVQTVLDEAVAAVADGLQVAPVGIAEIHPEEEALVLRAGVGWREGAIGAGRASAGRRSLVGYAVMAGEPVVSQDVAADPRFEISPFLRGYSVSSAAVVVIGGRCKPFGALGAFSPAPRSFSTDDINFLQAAANIVSAAVVRDEAETLVLEVREVERRRLARDLHDEVLQDLTDALAQATAAQRTTGEREATERLARLVPALKRAGQQVRAAIQDLRLSDADDRQLPELLEELVSVQSELAPEVAIELEVDPNLPTDALGGVGAELVRSTGEAIVNARRHSGAETVSVRVWRADDDLCVQVTDDGRGFDADAPPPPGSTGIASMRERVELMDGDLEIRSTDAGTLVRFSVPLGPGEAEAAQRTRVLLVEDHVAVREAIAAMFGRAPGFEVVGQAGSLAAARQMLADVDVAVVDLTLPDGYGGDLIRELRELNPRAQALVLSAGLPRSEVARAIESGAAGTLDKAASLDEVVEAVRRLRAGETLLPLEDIVDLLRLAARERTREHANRQAIASLTPREHEVLQLLAKGFGSHEIAGRLHITLRTERNHVASILTKLGVHSRLQAVVFALRYEIVELR